jgi:Xaa-Pro aminopeptidase
MTNIRYLTGFRGSDAALLVSPDDVTFVTDGRYAEQSRQEVNGAEIVISDRKWAEVSRRIRSLRRRMGPGRPARIGFEARHLTVELHRFLKKGNAANWVALRDPVEALRMRKEEGEIRAMEGASGGGSGTGDQGAGGGGTFLPGNRCFGASFRSPSCRTHGVRN